MPTADLDSDRKADVNLRGRISCFDEGAISVSQVRNGHL